MCVSYSFWLYRIKEDGIARLQRVLLQLRLTIGECEKFVSEERRAALQEVDSTLLFEIKMQKKWIVTAVNAKEKEKRRKSKVGVIAVQCAVQYIDLLLLLLYDLGCWSTTCFETWCYTYQQLASAGESGIRAIEAQQIHHSTPLTQRYQ
jgi:hypothetical protein